MATILKCDKREFKEDPNKIDNFRLFTDVSRLKNGIRPQNLNFDLRLLNPGQFSAPYHFHRNAEELFMVVSGSMTLRTPDGLEIVTSGDIVFFEMGETGAHQFYNHGTEPCTYLDIRTFTGHDVCEYPDSGKLLIAPSFEIFYKDSKLRLFDGEENILKKWKSQCTTNQKWKKPLVDNLYLLEKFPGKGGWTYAAIPEILQDKKAPFGWVKVKGTIDNYEIKNYRIMPMGNGKLFLPVKAEIRNKIGKKEGDSVRIVLYADADRQEIPEELLLCLLDNPNEHQTFLSYTDGEQKAFIDWIYSAKKEETKVARIAQTLIKLEKRQKFTDR